MPIHIAWDDSDRTTLRWDFEQGWDWDELRSAVAATELMIMQVQHRVNIIHNALSTPDVPSPTQRQKQHPLDLPAGVGVIVLVGDNPVLSALITIFMRVFHTLNSRLATASSLEEARLIIAEVPARA